MIDFRSFREEHPELCPEDRLRIPGLGTQRTTEKAEVGDWEEAYKGVTRDDPWGDPPPVRKLMQASGAEAFGYYLSFRLDPENWGIYMQGPPLVGLAREVVRVLDLGFPDLKERVPEEKAREVAFSMAYDIALNHLSLHASLDAFAARYEVEDGDAYYAPYQEGPYGDSLTDMTGPDGYNWEEVLANLVSLRSFLNASQTVEFGARVDSYFNDEEKYRWNGFLMSGMLTSELTYVMRPYPASHKNFTEFLRRRGEVGPYAHMAIQYDLNTEAFHAGLQRLAALLLRGREVQEPEKGLLAPVNPPVYLTGE
ncbi:MAG: hypothetical protein ACE5JE_03450 [Thermoplasmata archaeon]